MTFLTALLASIVSRLIAWIASTPRESGTLTYGNSKPPPVSLDLLRERGRKSGLVLSLVFVLSSCATREVVVASLYPVDDTTKGFPRLAENEVRVLIEGTDKVGTLRPAGGYFLVHETDLRAILAR